MISTSENQSLLKESILVFPDSSFESLKELQDSSVTQEQNSSTSTVTSQVAPSDRWRGYASGFSAASLVDDATKEAANTTINGVGTLVDGLSIAIEVLKAVSVVINAFQQDWDNLFLVVNYAVKELLKVLEEILVSIASTGVYGLLVYPSITPFSPDYKPAGFPEFKAKVSNALTNVSDPNRPIFYEGDYLGGVVLALVGATNLGDLLKDLQALAKYLNDESLKLAPVSALTATPGLFYKTEEQSKGGSVANVALTASNFLTSSIGGVKYPAIKLTWASPEGIPIDGYRIRRNMGKPQGVYTKKKDEGSQINPNDYFKTFYDPTFRLSDTFTSKTDRFFDVWAKTFGDDTSFTDFEVDDGALYYYSVTPLIKNKNGDMLESPGIGGFTSAVASTCLPDSALKTSYETPDGFRQGVATGDPPYWVNTNLRGMLGDTFDSLMSGLYGLAKRLETVSESNTKHFDKMIKTMEKWIENLEKFITKLKEVLDALRALQFSGAAMILAIPSEKGGIEGFKKRFEDAALPDPTPFYKHAGERKVTEGSTLPKIPNPFEDNLCAVCGGLVLIAGAPNPGASFDKLAGATKAQIQKVKQAGQFESAKKAFKEARERDYTQGKSDSAKDLSKYADKVISTITGFMGG